MTNVHTFLIDIQPMKHKVKKLSDIISHHLQYRSQSTNSRKCITNQTDASSYLLGRNENIRIDVLQPGAAQGAFGRDPLRRIQEQHAIEKLQCGFWNTIRIKNLYSHISQSFQLL